MWLHKSRRLLCTSMVGNGINPSRQHRYEDNAPQLGTEDVPELQAVTCGAHKLAPQCQGDSGKQLNPNIYAEQAICTWFRHYNSKPGTSLPSLAKGCGFILRATPWQCFSNLLLAAGAVQGFTRLKVQSGTKGSNDKLSTSGPSREL